MQVIVDWWCVPIKFYTYTEHDWWVVSCKSCRHLYLCQFSSVQCSELKVFECFYKSLADFFFICLDLHLHFFKHLFQYFIFRMNIFSIVMSRLLICKNKQYLKRKTTTNKISFIFLTDSIVTWWHIPLVNSHQKCTSCRLQQLQICFTFSSFQPLIISDNQLSRVEQGNSRLIIPSCLLNIQVVLSCGAVFSMVIEIS